MTVTTHGAESANAEVDVRVSGTLRAGLDVLGIAYPDLFGSLGAPEFDVAPEDLKCRDLAL